MVEPDWTLAKAFYGLGQNSSSWPVMHDDKRSSSRLRHHFCEGWDMSVPDDPSRRSKAARFSESGEKPDGENCRIREQILRDDASGLIFQFELDNDGYTHFRIFGDNLPFGNRDLIFSPQGQLAGSGTVAKGLTRPGWMTNTSDLAA